MTKRSLVLVLVALISIFCVPAVFADATGTVKGVCKDVEGKPIADAVVEYANTENGRKYTLKTNGRGEYFSLGIQAGKYTVTLSKDGKEIFHFNGYNVNADENTLDFDLKKEMANVTQGQGLSPDQAKAQKEQAEKIAKENATIKTLNENLAAAKKASDAGDFDTAISTMQQATQVDPGRELLWAKLGDYNLSSIAKQTDNAEKTKRYDAAASAFQKAIDIKQKTFDADPGKKTADATKQMAAFYNNLGKAEAQLGKTDDAVKAYNQAAQLDPAGAGTYYFNLGAILTNANVKNDSDMRNAAVQAFDKAITADPARADAYYWKGTNLIGAATLKGDKMVAPDGTAEAFQKYLELQPTGPHAEEAKAMLQGLGSSVETSYGTTKKKPTKK